MTFQEAASSAASGGSPNRGRYWRSLAELQQRDDFKQFLHREFPVAASEFPEGVSRRRWLQLMGASLAVAGVTGCRYPEESLAPFVLRPEGRVPGEPYHRATNFQLAGRVYNLLIECIDGRPIKIEPNTDHPSGGGTDPYVQASVLELYDPDRARGEAGSLLRRPPEGRPESASWEDFDAYAQALIRRAAEQGNGSSLAVLTPPTASPSVVRMLTELKQQLPEATVVRYDGVTGNVMGEATERVFGTPARQTLELREAQVIVAIQADILGNDRGFIRNAHGFAQKRNPIEGDMSRLYAVEGGYTQTGATADTRLAMRPGEMPSLIAALQRRVDELKAEGVPDDDEESTTIEPDKAFDELSPGQRTARFLEAAARDLAKAGDKAVVVVGEHLGAEAVAAGIELNRTLESLGTLQRFVPEIDADVADSSSLTDLVEQVDGGQIDSLIILGGNPVFTAPGDVPLAEAIRSLQDTIYLGEYDDETAAVCQWSLPLAHPLESWGDVVDDVGRYGVCQPQIRPLLGGRTVPEVLARMLDHRETDGQQIVRRTVDQFADSALSDRQWRQLLHDGYAEDLQQQFEPLTGDSGSDSQQPLTDQPLEPATAVDRDDIEVLFVPADGIYDGRFANNGWLQEMPQSLTKLTWDNAAIMSPATAEALGIRHGLMVAIRHPEATVELPVYEMPGCAPGVVTVAIGYGRTRAGMVGGLDEQEVPAVGTDIRPIRIEGAMLTAYAMEARPRFTEYELASTQDHWSIDELGRDETEERSFTLVREGTTALLEKVPEFAEAKGPHVPEVGPNGSLWQEPIDEIEEEFPKLPQWGMAIDLTKCIGCNACVVACQSENNVPVVGKEQVLNSREMHWLRVDRYFQGDRENADVVQQPLACVHCETAPCESVCPVAATLHTDDGINAMAYNRCIGTRYCSNNCPYKVRRFNFFNYNEKIGTGYGINAFQSSIETANRELQQLVLNPDVTVRGRGVMEKCTYCVQRVEQAKIEARRDGGRDIRDGDVITACQSACPTRAIEFGNLSDPDSKVSHLHADVRSYGMLAQLNTKPRTEYLARVNNPHRSLMTRFQLEDLAHLEPPHHGDHGAHGEHDAHGDHHEGGEGDVHAGQAHGDDETSGHGQPAGSEAADH